MNLKSLFQVGGKRFAAPTKAKEKLTFNQANDYPDISLNLDFAIGCGGLVLDVALDVGEDVASEAVSEAASEAASEVASEAASEVASEAASEVASEAASEAATEAAAEVAGESAAESIADAAADNTAGGGVQASTVSRWSSLKTALKQAVVDNLMQQATTAVTSLVNKYLIGGGSSGSGGNNTPTTPATPYDYWNTLSTQLSQTIYTCDNSAANPCGPASDGTDQRNYQEALVINFQAQLVGNSTSDATAAENLQAAGTLWTTTTVPALKAGLMNVANTNGIPSMINYLASYPSYPTGVSAGAIVIAGANLLTTVASFEFMGQ